MRTKPYNRDRSSRTRRKRTDKVDPSVYKIPIVESKSRLISPSFINHFFFSSTHCRRRDGSKPSNARTSHGFNMEVCINTVSTWIGCIDVDSIRGDYKEHKCTKTYRESSRSYKNRPCRRGQFRYDFFRVGERLKGGRYNPVLSPIYFFSWYSRNMDNFFLLSILSTLRRRWEQRMIDEL